MLHTASGWVMGQMEGPHSTEEILWREEQGNARKVGLEVGSLRRLLAMADRRETIGCEVVFDVWVYFSRALCAFFFFKNAQSVQQVVIWCSPIVPEQLTRRGGTSSALLFSFRKSNGKSIRGVNQP